MKYSSDKFQFENESEWEQLDEKLSRKIFGFNDNIMMVKVKFEKGGVGAVHSHPHSQTTYVESGKFEVTIGEETKTLEKADGFYAAPDVDHGVVCLEAGILIDVFNPVREDFLSK